MKRQKDDTLQKKDITKSTKYHHLRGALRYFHTTWHLNGDRGSPLIACDSYTHAELVTAATPVNQVTHTVALTK